MSTINFKIYSVSIFLFLVSACTKNTSAPVESFVEQSELSYHGMGQRNLGLKFILKGSSDRTITAVVNLPEYLDFKNQKINYRWQLDEGLNIVQGQATGEVDVPSNQKKIEIKLTVSNFSIKSNKFIRFEVSSDVVNGEKKNRFFIDGIVSSQSESSFENFVHDVENYKKKVHYKDEK